MRDYIIRIVLWKIYILYFFVINRIWGIVEYGYYEYIYNEFMFKVN